MGKEMANAVREALAVVMSTKFTVPVAIGDDNGGGGGDQEEPLDAGSGGDADGGASTTGRVPLPLFEDLHVCGKLCTCPKTRSRREVCSLWVRGRAAGAIYMRV